MRRGFVFVFVAFAALLIMAINMQLSQVLPNGVFQYYSDHFYQDTGARNAVTAIYLNYRVYDTLFETLMLLISVIAVIHFSRHEGEL